MKKPTVSIISSSYNHQKYIDYFIDSILKQTYNDFELIVIDDFSSDNNVKIARRYTDSRIKIIEHKYNKGPSIAVNDGIKKASGEFIAFLNTDDIAESNWLSTGIDFLNKNQIYQSVCFQLNGIDKNNNQLDDESLQNTLKFRNIEYYQLIRHMFITGNMLPSPGEIFRKSTFKKTGILNPSLLQTQDYDLHIRTLLQGEIFVFQKPLIKYRQINNGNNVDNHSISSTMRMNLEIPIVLDNFLNIDLELFKKVFHQDCQKIGEPIKETIPFFLGKIALNTNDVTRQKWGYQTILKYIGNQDNLDLLNLNYSIEFKDIIALINKINLKSKSQIKTLNHQFVKRIVNFFSKRL